MQRTSFARLGSRRSAARLDRRQRAAGAVTARRPGLSLRYLDSILDELLPGYQVASYQQRGLEPSTLEGPFAVEREVADAVAVLDTLGWKRAWVVGHSWGGHLLLHLTVAAPERLHGGLAIDPLGGVGDGGAAEFEAEILRRTPVNDRQRAEELDARAMQGEGTEADLIESMRLVWPAYFADPDRTLPFDDVRVSIPAYSGLLDSIGVQLPRLRKRCRRSPSRSDSWPASAAPCRWPRAPRRPLVEPAESLAGYVAEAGGAERNDRRAQDEPLRDRAEL
jgi:pimeloyl-ACP methyl ester carboxylesterase